MPKMLVTGFDPFGGESVNPAFEAVKLLPDEIAGYEVVKLEVPTVFTKSARVLEDAIDREEPDVVLCVGQAGGRSAMTVERVAINLVEARIPDNDGEQPMDEPVRADGETAYFATLPVKAMAKAMNDAGVPAFVSYTAGTYVCNWLMYNALYLLARKRPEARGGFVHVPFATEQVVGKANGMPSMSVSVMADALRAALEACVANDEDIKVVSGETH
ncbi:pyroglutamyl-peptidase I [uncultured Parolsenella sp.]|uniref:pyroglutamyl-peptidase I n=1 Tax=uncultured Parolsenella sp. TaxID=2083008 RepID=UPI0025CFFA5F|nr:pyroglutamyl-peptidase I [uncultured Parolsenella sp.]